jgi:hypothetical protein
LACGVSDRGDLDKPHTVEALPLVTRLFAVLVTIAKAKHVRAPDLVARDAFLGDLDEAQGDKLANGWRDGVSIHPVFHKVVVGAGQFGCPAAVARVFDFEPGHDPMSRDRKNAVRWRFKHVDVPPGELPDDRIVDLPAIT